MFEPQVLINEFTHFIIYLICLFSDQSCFAFTCAYNDTLGAKKTYFQCHVFRCVLTEAVTKVFVSFAQAFKKKKRNQKYWSPSHKPTHSKRTRMFFVRSHSRNQRKNRKYQYFRHGSPSKRRFQIALKFGEKSGDKCSTNITKFVQIGCGKVFWNVGQSWEECAAC